MKRILFCLMVLSVLSPLSANGSEKDEILQQSRKVFGKPLDISQNLFEINSFYVFRIDFDKEDRTAELAVEPKYYFEESHPDWKENDEFKLLKFAEYKSLLEKLEKIKTKGGILEKAKIGITGNGMTFYRDKYKFAILETDYVFTFDNNENKPAEIKYFKINFRKDRKRVRFDKAFKF